MMTISNSNNIMRRIAAIILMVIITVSSSISTVSAASVKIKIVNNKAVPTLTQGQNFSIRGTIKSNVKVKRIEIGVVNASTKKWVKGLRYDRKKLNVKKFSVANARKTVKFNKLSPGTYYYRIYVHPKKGKVRILVNQKFTVKAKATAKTTTSTANTIVGKVAPNLPDTTVKLDSGTSATIKGGISIPDHSSGLTYSIKGTISCSDTIKRVEIGVVSSDTGKWVDGAKYDNASVNSTTFDVSKAASSVNFSKLSTGAYWYRIYVHTQGGEVITLLNQKFNVLASGANQKAIDAACAWAVMIANDNSFTYGKQSGTWHGYAESTNKRAHMAGCYFCGTNRNKFNGKYCGKEATPGSNWDKTYCCNPFVHAAWAHGAGDANMLKACKNGSGIGMTVQSFTRYGNWKSMGKISYSSLKKGDVIVKSNHVILYIGNGQVAQATGGTWSANSIRVNSFSASDYSKFSFVMRYTGTGKF